MGPLSGGRIREVKTEQGCSPGAASLHACEVHEQCCALARTCVSVLCPHPWSPESRQGVTLEAKLKIISPLSDRCVCNQTIRYLLP